MYLVVNSVKHQLKNGDLDKKLLEYLREDLDLTGTKNGCNIGVCGACTVLVNNQPKRACVLTVKAVVDKTILTIEGMTINGELHPLQKCFLDNNAVQCGFCTPGMVLSAHALLLKNSNPNEKEIRDAIKVNLCRCTGYQQIIKAISEASQYYKEETNNG
ncbi:MAG: xanthine dehydrogenase [Candidatus Cloacimonetes bacterium 4572_65]|nr:MAG: xanthine dehydrogenase [Candidatus Cloacimonetes bacterium 4572_65]